MGEYQQWDSIVIRWTAEVFPRIWVESPKRPCWWIRIWHYVFFGIRWRPRRATHVPQEKEE